MKKIMFIFSIISNAVLAALLFKAHKELTDHQVVICELEDKLVYVRKKLRDLQAREDHMKAHKGGI